MVITAALLVCQRFLAPWDPRLIVEPVELRWSSTQEGPPTLVLNVYRDVSHDIPSGRWNILMEELSKACYGAEVGFINVDRP